MSKWSEMQEAIEKFINWNNGLAWRNWDCRWRPRHSEYFVGGKGRHFISLSILSSAFALTGNRCWKCHMELWRTKQILFLHAVIAKYIEFCMLPSARELSSECADSLSVVSEEMAVAMKCLWLLLDAECHCKQGLVADANDNFLPQLPSYKVRFCVVLKTSLLHTSTRFFVLLFSSQALSTLLC